MMGPAESWKRFGAPNARVTTLAAP